MGVDFVDIWQGRLSVEKGGLPEFWRVLSDAERRKAESLINGLVRGRYVATRGLLRLVLANYLHCAPESVRFATGLYGKPYLVDGGVYFSLSHTGDLMVLAVSGVEDVGVDVETIRFRKGMGEVARRCFSVEEYSVWEALSPHERVDMFFRLWTIKEAFVKAVGRGIALGLERCEVALPVCDGLINVPDEYGDARVWGVRQLLVDPGFAGALVVSAHDFVCRQYSFDVFCKGEKKPL